MRVRIAKNHAVSLEQDEDFRRFDVAVASGAGDLDAIRGKVAPNVDIVDETTAWVDEGWLRAQPSRATDAVWQESVSRMLSAVAPMGWYDADRGAIKAHIEWNV
jgi:hypothetical protein